MFVLKFVFKFLQCLFLWSLWCIDSCWHGDRNWSNILYGTIPNPEGHRLGIFILKFCDKCFTISFFFQRLQSILFICGVTIEPCLKFYAVPSQSQCKTLRSRSQTLIFCVKSLQCQLLQSLWLIWIVFGMNGYKILKCFRKEKCVYGNLTCPATGLIKELPEIKGLWLKYF